MSPVPRQRPSGAPQLRPHVEPINVGTPEPPEFRSADVPQSGTPAVRETGSTAQPQSGTSDVSNSGTSGPRKSGNTGVPKYQTMERVDTRLRPDQVTTLARLRKRVARSRSDKRERITDATLVRIALDLLFDHSDALHGDTEDALRESVRTALR